MIQLRPRPSATELADYADRLHAHVAANCPDLLDAIFGGER